MQNCLYTVLFLLIFQIALVCQTSVNIPITVSVSAGPVMNKIRGDLDFGDVLSTSTLQTLNKTPDNGVLFEVNGTPRSRVAVNYSTTVSMNNNNWVIANGGEFGNLSFVPEVMQTGASSTYTNPRNVKEGRRIRIRNDNGIGRLFLWIGGEIEVQPDQPNGDYEGIFNITVAY